MGTVALACGLWTWCLLLAVMVQMAYPLVLPPQCLATVLTEGEGVNPSFHLNMRWASAQEPGILSLSLYPILLKSGRSTSAAHGLMKSALQDSRHRESWTYRRDARPAQYPGVSSTGSHGRNPWTWSLSRALLSRCLLTVIVFPRGNGADSRSKF